MSGLQKKTAEFLSPPYAVEMYRSIEADAWRFDAARNASACKVRKSAVVRSLVLCFLRVIVSSFSEGGKPFNPTTKIYCSVVVVRGFLLSSSGLKSPSTFLDYSLTDFCARVVSHGVRDSILVSAFMSIFRC